MTDASLVSPEILRAVVEKVSGESGGSEVLTRLSAREPVLGTYIVENLLVLSGKLALSGAPPDVVQACYDDMIKLVAVSVGSVWKASDDLWKGIRIRDIARAASRRRRGAVRQESAEGGSAPPSAPT